VWGHLAATHAQRDLNQSGSKSDPKRVTAPDAAAACVILRREDPKAGVAGQKSQRVRTSIPPRKNACDFKLRGLLIDFETVVSAPLGREICTLGTNSGYGDLPSILWLDRSVRMGSPPPAPPRMSNVGPTPRPVKSAIRYKANNGRRSLSRAIGPARRRAVRAKGINCYGDIGHEGATLRPNTRYVPAVMMSDDGPIGHECLCCVGAGQQQRNCRCHQPNQ